MLPLIDGKVIYIRFDVIPQIEQDCNDFIPVNIYIRFSS